MKMQYLPQFPMVSHHSGLVLNVFYNAFNVIASAFTADSAFIFAATTAVYYRLLAPAVISQAFPHRSPSLWGHFERIFKPLSICGNHFWMYLHFRHCHHSTSVHCRVFRIIVISLVSMTITTSLPPHFISVSLIGKSGGWFAVSAYGWPSIEGFSSVYHACCRALRMFGIGMDKDRSVTEDSHNSSWDGMMSLIIRYTCNLSL